MIKGKVWKYGDNINTDIISPPAYMELSISEAAKYAMSPIDPDFGKAFKEGDLLVAENNFGSGSSRETAPLTLRHLGVRVIIAKSFARIFYRNAINLGILALESQEAGKISQDDVLEIDYKAGIIKNITRDERYTCTIMPDHIMTIIDAGGLVTYLKAKKKTQ
ncbi:MAG: 3-isopropylmalate dehydratase [delta proteobacterium ML8_F1]|nr:MAG: 3-isopropylmalate dehydratase [delta proteobacterium ML8_F1]